MRHTYGHAAGQVGVVERIVVKDEVNGLFILGSLFPYQVGPLIVAMQLSGERLGNLLKITLPLALITFVALVPLDYLWWRLLGWL